jgi:hypothetical protein
MSQNTDATPTGEVEQSVSESVRTELGAQEPSKEEKDRLRQQHEGHLVRDTTSKLAVDSAEMGAGIEVDAQAEIPDTYCFDCEEWVGLSGVDLRGTPRSRADAYYLGGMPIDVLHAKNGTIETINELAEALLSKVDKLDNLDDAYAFIKTTLEEERSLNAEIDSEGGEAVAQ